MSYINKKLQFQYHLDKLHINYNYNDSFIRLINDSINTFFKHPFSFNPINKHLSFKMYEVMYCESDELVKIGIISFSHSDCVILEVDNRLLYSDKLFLVHRFADSCNLDFDTFSKIDICCDSNVDLPFKLNRLLHSSNYTIKRRSRGLLTKKGNINLGYKIIPNVKTIKEKENKPTTYYFTSLKTSRCYTKVKLVGYNKSAEVESESNKRYIIDSLPFGHDVVHRLEVRTYGYEMTCSKIDIHDLYAHIPCYDYWERIFLFYLNRFFEFHENDGDKKGGKVKKHRASDLLRLTSGKN